MVKTDSARRGFSDVVVLQIHGQGSGDVKGVLPVAAHRVQGSESAQVATTVRRQLDH